MFVHYYTKVSSHVFQMLLVKIFFCDFSTSSNYKPLALQNVMISLDLFWTRYAVMFLLQSSIQIWTNNSQKQTMPCNLPPLKKPALNCSMKNIENSTAGFHIFSRDWFITFFLVTHTLEKCNLDDTKKTYH